jgi:hypothetical protein
LKRKIRGEKMAVKHKFIKVLLLLIAVLATLKVHIPTDGLENPLDEDVRSIAAKACNKELDKNTSEKIREQLNPNHPDSVKIEYFEDSCAFRFAVTIERSDMIGYGAPIDVEGVTVIQLYNIFDTRLVTDDRPSMLIFPGFLFAPLFL